MAKIETRSGDLAPQMDRHDHEETRLSDAELIRLADAYTINMLDDPRPLPGDDAEIEHSTQVFLKYMREFGYAHAAHHTAPPGVPAVHGHQGADPA